MNLRVTLWLDRGIEWNGFLSCGIRDGTGQFHWAFGNLFEFSDTLERLLSATCTYHSTYRAAQGESAGGPVSCSVPAAAPRPSHRVRSFRAGHPPATEGEWDNLRKKAVTELPADALSAHKNGNSFVIQVLYRQNASWQGNLTWLEAQKTVPFRSCLELIRLLDEAVGTDGAPGWGIGAGDQK